MLFKQAKIFKLEFEDNIKDFNEKLNSLAFKPCLPSMFSTMGWVAPIEEVGVERESASANENDDAEEDNDDDDDEKVAVLAYPLNDYILICLQTEEKILPSTVIREELKKHVKRIEQAEHRKVRRRESLSLRDEITHTLLSRAFSRITKTFAFIDIKNNWLIIGTSNKKKTEQFISMINKLMDEEVVSLDTKGLSYIMTQWLEHKNYPNSFSVEKACVLQDPSHQNRVLRCQEQDLFSRSFQSLLKDGYEAKQIALCWQDQVNFILTDEFILQSIGFTDELRAQSDELDPETKQQEFEASFFIEAKTLSGLIKELLEITIDKIDSDKTNKANIASKTKENIQKNVNMNSARAEPVV